MKLFTFAVLVTIAMALLLSCGGGKPAHVVLVLEVDTTIGPPSQDELQSTIDVLERRLAALDIDGSARLAGETRIEVLAKDAVDAPELEALARGGRLMFCEPILNAAGQIAIARDGTVHYEPASCISSRDAAGNPVVEGGTVEYADWSPNIQTFSEEEIMWQPATGRVSNGGNVMLTGEFLQPNVKVIINTLEQPELAVEFNDDGAEIMGQVTQRLLSKNYPLGIFLDGQPLLGEDGSIIAPTVRAKVTSNGAFMGLSETDARLLSVVLNSGSLPLPVRAVQPD